MQSKEYNNNTNFNDTEELIDIKELLFKFLGKWYWFVLFGFAGSSLAYIYTKYQNPVYQLSSSVLITEVRNSGVGLEKMFEGINMGGSTKLENHIGIYKSYSINNQVVNNLNLGVAWFKKGIFIDLELYKQEPFQVLFSEEKTNLTGVKISITPLTKETFKISASGETTLNGTQQEFTLDQEGHYGEAISQPQFHFTLLKKREIELEDQYYFKFNNLNSLTLAYVAGLSAAPSSKQSDIIKLELKGTVAEKASDYLNELNRVFIQFGLNQKNQISKNTVEFIDSQLSGITESLNKSGQSFTDFKSRNRMMDISKEASIIAEKVKQVEQEKTVIDMQLEYYRNTKKYLNDPVRIKKMVSPSVVGIQDPSLGAAIIKLGELYQKREVLLFNVKEKNPGLMILDKELEMIRMNLEENLNNLIHNTEITQRYIIDRIGTIDKQMTILPETEQEFINIKRQFDINSSLYTFLLQKRAEAEITTASNVPDAYVIDKARIETSLMVFPKNTLNYMIGLILGLLLPLIWFVLTDYFDDSISDISMVEKGSSLNIVGSIAHNHHESHLPVRDYPRASITESFRGLRTNLQFLLPAPGQKVISIHSTLPNEGKSFVSLNLATVLAMNNKKVVIVGCDMRKPKLDKMLMLNNDAGLSTLLIDSHTLRECVQPTVVKNLYAITSGPIPPNPAELLDTQRWNDLIELLKEQYDFIVLDNAPLSMVTDGFITGKLSDTNLIILRLNASHRNEIRFLNDIAQKGTLQNVAIVINDVQSRGYGYKHYSLGYGYGYGYGYGAKYGYYGQDEEHNTLSKNWRQHSPVNMINRLIERLKDRMNG
ncbi:MAG: polysaccharide biosynthesis tyrosine autokinase [Prolixibacteraceae bacterium]|jgi:capsular exopolysaccharide synthesis family protein|nr:polysaccharide biosynthesis tyrosine autokinase [Prolixibacteraceae bacterium]